MARFFRQWFRQAIANAMSFRANRRRRRIGAMTVMPKPLSLDLVLEGRETPGSLLEGMLSALVGGTMTEPLAAVAAFDSSAFAPRVANVPVSFLESPTSSDASSRSSSEVPAWLSDVEQYASRGSDVDTSSGDASGFVAIGVDDLPASGFTPIHFVQSVDAQAESHAGGGGEESLVNFRGSTSTDTSTPVLDIHEPQALMGFAPPASPRAFTVPTSDYGGKPYWQYAGNGNSVSPSLYRNGSNVDYSPLPNNNVAPYSINGTGVPTPSGIAPANDTPQSTAEPLSISEAQSILAATPLMFERNVLRGDNGYEYLVRGSGQDAYVGATGAAFTIVDPVSAAGRIPPQGRDRKRDWTPSELKSSTVRLEIIGANPKAQSSVGSMLPTTSNYLLGTDDSSWVSGVENYESVSYANVLPGVGLKFYGSSQDLAEYDFTVNPGSNPSSIRLRVNGATSLKLDDAGNLIAATESGNLTFHAPLSYQEGEKGRVTVKSAFQVKGNEVGFVVGDYDKSKLLVIDPTVLIYGSYTKSGTGDAVLGVAADAAGYVYLTGTTGVTGKNTAFLTKLSPDGKTAISTTFIGGSTSDQYTYDVGRGVTVDASGYVYVVGETHSPTFASKNALYPFNGGLPVPVSDAFATKLSTDAKTIVYSTPIGGKSADWANAVTTNTGGSMYIVGHTESSDLPLSNPLQPAGSVYPGFSSGFAMRLSWNSTTSKLSTSFTTYLGDQGSEATGVVRDANNNMYVTGFSLSNATVFQNYGFISYSTLTTGAGLNGDAAFVMKLNAVSPPPPGVPLPPPGQYPFAPAMGLFFGGSDYDYPTGITLDTVNNVYLSGVTASNNLLMVGNSWQNQLNQGVAAPGYTDGFFAEIAANGQSVMYSTYLGGQQDDAANTVSVNAAGQVFVGGESYFDTTDINFKNLNRARSMQLPNGASNSKGTDGFVARFDYGTGDGDYPLLPWNTSIPVNPNGLNPKYITPIGGASGDMVRSVAAGTNGNVFVGGETYSTNFPLNVPYSSTPNGGFAARIGYSKITPSNFYSTTGSTASGTPLAQFTMSITYPSYTATIDWGDGTGTSAGTVTTSDGITYSVTGGSHPYSHRGVYTVTTTIFANDGTKIGTATSTGTISPILPAAYAPAPTWDESASPSTDIVQTNPAVFGDFAQSPYSDYGVRYVDGQLRVTATDIGSDGFGSGWKIGRTWAGSGSYSLGSGFGLTEKSGWVDTSNPYIVQSGTSIVLFTNGTTVHWYDQSGGSWVPRVPDGSVITFDGTYYVLADTMGRQTKFNTFVTSQPFYQIGAFQSQLNADGFLSAVTLRDSLGRQTEITRVSGTTIEKYTTAYTVGDSADKSFKSSVTLSRSIAGGAYTTIRKVVYGYTANQLTTVTVQDGSPTPATLEQWTYGYTGDQLSSVKGTRATQSGGTADLTIVSTAGKVTSITPAGMSATTYAYVTSTNAVGYNNWATKTTETLATGNQNIVYTNGYGQVMLRSFKEVATGREWINYFHYNSNGQIDYKANPSAISGYSDSFADLVNFVAGNASYLRDAAGLVEVQGYSGLLKSSRGVKQGETGAGVNTETWTFVSVPSAGATFYALSTDTLIPDPNNSLLNRKTTYGYTWFSGTAQPQSVAITTPDGATTTTVYDNFGRPSWLKDGAGFIHYTAYDLASGGVTKTIHDVNTTKTADFTGLPSGWTTPSGGGLHLSASLGVDAIGRTTSVTMSNGRSVTTNYNDAAHTVTVNDGGPTRVQQEDFAGNKSVTTSGSSKTQANLNAAGQVTSNDVYTDATTYLRTTMTYDTMGRLDKTTDPASIITQNSYDALGRVVSEKKAGVVVKEYEYDDGGVGDGNITKVTVHPGAGLPDRVTQNWFDWRNRAVYIKQGVQAVESTDVNRPVTYTFYNNLNETVKVDTYDGDGISATVTAGVPNAPSASLLRGETVTTFDSMGRVYVSGTNGVNPDTGAIGVFTGTTTIYDARGKLTATGDPGGSWTIDSYDGAGRKTAVYTTNGSNLSASTVLEQSEYALDGNGNTISVTRRVRVDGQTGLGVLGTPTTGVLARVTYQAMYFDSADRLIASADFGTNGGAAWTRPTTVPTASDTILVTTAGFDSNGFPNTQTDPQGLVESKNYNLRGDVTSESKGSGAWTMTTVLDAAGRVSTETGPDGRVTKTEYDSIMGFVAKITKRFGLTGFDQPTNITADNLGETVSTTDAVSSKQVKTYDVLGRVASSTDASGVSVARTTSYLYDPLGRQIQVTDAANHATKTVYYDNARQVVTLDALNFSWTKTFDGFGNVISDLNPFGKGTTNTIDGFGRIAQSADGNNNKTTYKYNVSGDRDSVTDPRTFTSYVVRDLFGRNIQTIDADSKTTSYTFDRIGRKTQMTDPRGIITQYSFDNLGRITQTKTAVGTTDQTITSDTFNASGDLTSSTDARGTVTTFTIDSAGRRSSEAKGGLTTAYEFDALDRIVKTTSPGSRAVFTVLDALGQKSSSTVGFGTTLAQQSSYTFDVVGNLLTETNALGLVTKYTYDALNRVVSTTEAFGTVDAATSTVAYDKAGRVSSTTDARGYVTSYVYDDGGRKTAVVDPYGTTSSTYDAANNILSITDPTGIVQASTYDKLNRILTIAVNNETTNYSYDSDGNVLTATDPRGFVTTNTYDWMNRLKTSTDPFGKSTTDTYDSNGNLLTETDERGGVTTYTYDTLDRKTKVTDALTKYKTFGYDPSSGDLISSKDETAAETKYAYDLIGRRYSVTAPGTGVTTTAYDSGNRVVSITSAISGVTTNAYDNQNRLVSVTNPVGGVTKFTYDSADNRTSVTDPVNNVTSYSYDKLNRLVSETDPLGKATTYAYDAAGRQTSVTDRLGRVKVFAYDSKTGRLSTESWYASSGGSLIDTKSYAYDASGNLLTAVNGAGTYTFTYDKLNRVATVAEPFNINLTFGYDDAGNRTSVTDNAGGTQSSVYDLDGQLTSRVETVGASVARLDYTYTDRGEKASETRYSNAVGTTKVGSTAWTYKPDGMVDTITMAGPTGLTLATFNYSYDAADRLTSKTENSVTTSYTYDKAGQILTEGAKSYTYDANGNRTIAGYVTIAGNRLQTDGTTNFVYDDMGAVTKATTIATGKYWTYAYDLAGHLTNATYYTSAGVVISAVSFTYDAFSNKVQRAETGATTRTDRYAYDGWNPGNSGAGGSSMFDAVIDMDGTNVVTARHIYGDDVDNAVAVIAGGSVSWYGIDRQNSIRKVFNNSGTIVASSDFDAFGNLTAGVLTDRIGYTARVFDSTLGLYDNRDRFRNTSTNTFLNEDPIGFDGGDTNLRRYASNSSTNGRDPSGNWLFMKPDAYPGLQNLLAAHGVSTFGGNVPRANWGGEFYKMRVMFIESRYQNRAKDALVAEGWSEDKASQVAAAMSSQDQGENNVYARYGTNEIESYSSKRLSEDQIAAVGLKHSEARGFFVEQMQKNGEIANTGFKRPVMEDPNAAGARAFQEGVEGGLIVLTNELTFHQIDDLDVAAKHLIATEPVYKSSQLAGIVVREIGITIATGGSGAILTGVGGRVLGRVAASTLSPAVRCAATKGVKVFMAGNMVYSSFSAVEAASAAIDAAFDAYMNGADETVIAEKLTKAGIETAQAVSTFGSLYNMARQIGKVGFKKFFGGCFAAGTPVRTPEGSKLIEEIREGDLVLARDEKDAEGTITTRRVEAVFSRVGHLLLIRAGGIELRTTPEHPFFVQEKGWVLARDLTSGDKLLCEDDSWVAIDETVDTKELIQVYNFAVSEDHTYFVGTESRAFWVHNSGNNPGLPCDGSLPTGGEPADSKPATPTSGPATPTGSATPAPGAFDPAATRPKLRKSTKEQAQANAPKNADGDFVDPNTGKVIPKDGPFDYGHPPGEEWWRLRDKARAEGWTRKQVIEAENAKRFQIEDPSSNRSHKHEQPR